MVFTTKGAGGSSMKQSFFVTFFEILIIVTILAVSATAQVCGDTIYIRDTTVVNVPNIKIPISLGNPCEVGGFNMVLTTSAPGILAPKGGDTSGTRLNWHMDIDTVIIDTFGNTRIDSTIHPPWEYFSAAPGSGARSDSLYVAGLAEFDLMPPITPPLDSGRGTIFYAKFGLPCNNEFSQGVIDTFVELQVARVFVSDPDGHTNPVEYYNANIHYIFNFDSLIRGDCNCNGERRGSDVTYLVAYFKGLAGCPCTIKAGDANGNGFVDGGDVTYLVRYFKGLGDPPPPY
jgi:hypothetical protein